MTGQVLRGEKAGDEGFYFFAFYKDYEALNLLNYSPQVLPYILLDLQTIFIYYQICCYKIAIIWRSSYGYRGIS